MKGSQLGCSEESLELPDALLGSSGLSSPSLTLSEAEERLSNMASHGVCSTTVRQQGEAERLLNYFH